jgi:HK97 family phage portal protein
MLEALEEFNKKSGPTEAGKIRHLPVNTDLIFDNALSLADAQFIATMKFNNIQISSLYGVPPSLVGILEATKYNNVEIMMLDFKASTLSAIGRMYRQEFESKLLTMDERLAGKAIEFNYNALMESDSTTRINNERTMLGMGVATINDVCKLEGFATYPEGNAHYVPGNYLQVEQIANKNNEQINKTNKG